MPGSSRRIDYRLRPAKHTERLMLADAFTRLSKFEDIRRYQYIGLGSLYFTDFSVFHRALGINKMINIEGYAQGQERGRFRANSPLNIDLRFGLTGSELPKLDFSQRAIIWLDYDGRLEANHLNDISLVARKCASGTALVVTVQAAAEVNTPYEGRITVESLANQLGFKAPDPTLRDGDLVGNGTASLFRSFMTERLNDSLRIRNRTIASAHDKMSCEQIFNFIYKDGIKMLTVGWIIFSDKERITFNSCEFDQFDFYRSAAQPFEINVPHLTPRELRILQKQVPLKPGEAVRPGCMPPTEAQKFVDIYRYLPHYSTADWF